MLRPFIISLAEITSDISTKIVYLVSHSNSLFACVFILRTIAFQSWVDISGYKQCRISNTVSYTSTNSTISPLHNSDLSEDVANPSVIVERKRYYYYYYYYYYLAKRANNIQVHARLYECLFVVSHHEF